MRYDLVGRIEVGDVIEYPGVLDPRRVRVVLDKEWDSAHLWLRVVYLGNLGIGTMFLTGMQKVRQFS